MATHDLKAFSYLFGRAQKDRVLLALRCEQCIAPRIGLSSSFSRCIPPSANKAQKRLTASSLMLTTGCHCGVRRLRPFRLCVPHLSMGLPISQTPCMYLIFWLLYHNLYKRTTGLLYNSCHKNDILCSNLMNITVRIVQLRCACLSVHATVSSGGRSTESVLFISTGCGTDAG